ncbi:MAG: tRNA 2-thiocytidine biosynthesis TtcA family protein [Christensenellaceae bacterium]|jgi:tRNA 2-thiocytidine biosynthesis protein TtcA
MKKVLGHMRTICEAHHMIKNGDKIAIGLSGGKDSMLLLYAMQLYKQYMKQDFSLMALTVDVGFPGFDAAGIAAYAQTLEIPHETIHTNIAEVVFDIRKEKNPCALCSKMRKGALYERANALGFNKVAYAHNLEDALETLLLSLVYEGKLSTFAPVSYLSRRNITLIRPFGSLPEKAIIGAVNRLNIPIYKNPCPVDGHTKRVRAREWINLFLQSNPDAKKSMFSALKTAGKYYIWGLPAGINAFSEEAKEQPGKSE